MQLSTEQQNAVRLVREWMHSDRQRFALFGYAGTGKTTLAKYLTQGTKGLWKFAAFTGKAAHILNQKGCPASTLHSLVYRPNGRAKNDVLEELLAKKQALTDKALTTPLVPDETRELARLDTEIAKRDQGELSFKLWPESPLAEKHVAGIVVDEVSMVGRRLGEDLERFGKKILVLGDPAQLPPVKSGGYLTDVRPDVLLTDVRRQGRESDILRLATCVRNNQQWPNFHNDVRIIQRNDKNAIRDAVMNADQVLCGKNRTRHAVNRRIRQILGFTEPTPMPNDKLVCLMNDRQRGLYNGSFWHTTKATPDIDSMLCELVLKADDDSRVLETESWLYPMLGRERELETIPNNRSFDRFDYGYCLTVHKSQGSQWNNVVLFDESSVFQHNSRRWLYTGVTRASKQLTIVR